MSIEPNSVRTEYGAIRTDFSDEELARIPKDKRERFVALVEAKKKSDAAKCMHADAVQHGKELLELRDKQIANKALDYPPETFMSARTKVIEATRRK